MNKQITAMSHKFKTIDITKAKQVRIPKGTFDKDNDVTIFLDNPITGDLSRKPKEIEKSNGQLFKEKYGFSKSMKRNMQRKGMLIKGITEYSHAELKLYLMTYRNLRKTA